MPVSSDALLPLIVTPDTLASHAGHASLLIIDVPLDPRSYYAGHVPGAVFLDARDLMAGTGSVPNLPPSPEHLAALFSSLGVTPDTHVVAYDDEGGGWAGRLLWTLALIGHARYSYLDGGIHAWRADGYATEQEVIEPIPSTYEITQINEHCAIDVDTLRDQLDTFTIWDARSAEEYRGELGNSRRRGHIPKAINLDWRLLRSQDNAFRLHDEATLRALLSAHGLHDDLAIVTHCQSHHRSGLTWLVGQALGLDIRAYPGSWQEWGNRDDTPITV